MSITCILMLENMSDYIYPSVLALEHMLITYIRSYVLYQIFVC